MLRRVFDHPVQLVSHLLFQVGALGEDGSPRRALVLTITFWIPQLRTFERPRAVKVALFDLDFDRKLRRASTGAQALQESRIIHDPRLTVDAHGPLFARN